MPTIGGGDDFVWIGGPDEGLWLLVVVGDEAIDGGLEIDDAFEDAALLPPLGALFPLWYSPLTELPPSFSQFSSQINQWFPSAELKSPK
jgi:hypothetical protein